MALLPIHRFLHQPVNIGFETREFFVEIAGEFEITHDGVVEAFVRNQQGNTRWVGREQYAGNETGPVVDFYLLAANRTVRY